MNLEELKEKDDVLYTVMTRAKNLLEFNVLVETKLSVTRIQPCLDFYVLNANDIEPLMTNKAWGPYSIRPFFPEAQKQRESYAATMSIPKDIEEHLAQKFWEVPRQPGDKTVTNVIAYQKLDIEIQSYDYDRHAYKSTEQIEQEKQQKRKDLDRYLEEDNYLPLYLERRRKLIRDLFSGRVKTTVKDLRKLFRLCKIKIPSKLSAAEQRDRLQQYIRDKQKITNNMLAETEYGSYTKLKGLLCGDAIDNVLNILDL